MKDPKTHQIYAITEKGERIVIPPNIQSVPSLLVVQQKYRVIQGDEIIKHYHPVMTSQNRASNPYLGEPAGFSIGQFGGGGVNSEFYTDYNLSPEELSAKGISQNRRLYNYVSAQQEIITIDTPDDTYKPNKVSGDITVDILQQKRMDDLVGK
jgi:hypothetical protein